MTFGIGRAVAATESRKGEHVWSLAKDGHRIDVELLDQSDAGMELRTLKDGEWCSGRRFSDREAALRHAERNRIDLATKGWQPAP